MRNLTKKITALGLSVLLIASVPVHADTAQEIYKDETVYGLIDASGQTTKLIVSDYIHSAEKLETLKDISNLQDVHNLRSDVLPEKDQTSLTWQVDGYELNYQGTSQQALPVDTTITYYLDGVETTPEALIGKSGELKMVIHQDNLVYTEAEIMGTQRKVYAPFYTLATMRFDASNFTDVAINQGKISNDGANFLVVGFLAPGMTENFGDLMELKVEDDLIISAIVTNYEAQPMYLAMSNKLPDVEDISLLDQVDQLDSSLAEFKKAGNDLVNGATDLSDGQVTYFEKFGEATVGLKTFLSSIDKLSEGVKQIASPLTQLVEGASSLSQGILALQNSASPLVDGYVKFSEGTKSFADGAKAFAGKVEQLSGALAALPEKAELLATSSDALTAGIKKTDDGLSSVASGSDALLAAMKGFQNSLAKDSKEYAAYSSIVAEMEKLNGATSALSDGMTQISSNMTTFNAGVDAFAEQASGLSAVQEGLNEGSKQLSAAATELVSGAAVLQNGTLQLTEGMSALVSGSQQLEGGLRQLDGGMQTLLSKLPELKNANQMLSGGFDALQTASTALIDGGVALKEGMTQFNQDGIRALTDKIEIEEGKLDEALAIKEVLDKLAIENSTFSGAPESFITSVNYLLKVTQ